MEKEFKKFTSKLLGKDFYVHESGGIRNGLPVYTPKELNLIKTYADSLTKNDHEMLYELKLSGAQIDEMAVVRPQRKTVEECRKELPLSTRKRFQQLRDIVKNSK